MEQIKTDEIVMIFLIAKPAETEETLSKVTTNICFSLRLFNSHEGQGCGFPGKTILLFLFWRKPTDFTEPPNPWKNR